MSSGKKIVLIVLVLVEYVFDYFLVFVVVEDIDVKCFVNGGLCVFNYLSDEVCIVDG